MHEMLITGYNVTSCVYHTNIVALETDTFQYKVLTIHLTNFLWKKKKKLRKSFRFFQTVRALLFGTSLKFPFPSAS